MFSPAFYLPSSSSSSKSFFFLWPIFISSNFGLKQSSDSDLMPEDWVQPEALVPQGVLEQEEAPPNLGARKSSFNHNQANTFPAKPTPPPVSPKVCGLIVIHKADVGSWALLDTIIVLIQEPMSQTNFWVA